MKTQTKSSVTNNELRTLSISIGNFIHYWGFRRIHGAIWTQVYLSKAPLNCTQLAENLALSKALVSPALQELCEHKLIEEVSTANEKTKFYQAASNVSEVVKNILKTREHKMLNEINNNFSDFVDKNNNNESLDQERVQSLQEMILSANLLLELVLSQNEILQFPSDDK
jgi:DNA-binding transcriptional regulator GbsR (MarR family)